MLMLLVPAKARVKLTLEEVLLQEEMQMVSRMKEAMVIIKGSQGKITLEVHQGNLLLPGTKVYFLVISIPVQTLGTSQKIVGHITKDIFNGHHQSSRRNFARSHAFLFMNNIECFQCHNIGYMAHDCNLIWAPTQARTMPEEKVTQVWRRKHIESRSLLNTPANNTCC